MKAELKNQSFTGSQTFKHSFEETLLIHCKFEEYLLEGANLYEAEFIECSFKKVDFYWASMFGAKFINCKLEEVDFRGAYLKEVLFTGCQLIGCDFSHDNLGGDTDLTSTTFTDSPQINCNHTKFNPACGLNHVHPAQKSFEGLSKESLGDPAMEEDGIVPKKT